MICDPNLRRQFVDAIKQVDASLSEQQILWRLMSLRKRKAIGKKSQEPGAA